MPPGLTDLANGPAIPFRIGPDGRVAMTSGTDKVRQNLRAVLATRIGERIMQRDFGTRLASLVHDPNDEALSALVTSEARDALLRWEPRLMVTATRVERAEGELRLYLDYIELDRQTGGQLVISL
jgi:phage baseplate assembly protein W